MVSVDLSSRQFSFSNCLILFVFLLLCDIWIKSNQISLPIYLVKCHPSIELLRVKWEENYLRSYVVAVGKEWQCLFATILHGTKLRHPFLSRDYTSYFIFLFPSMRSLVPGYFAIIFIAEFETDLIRQSNNKIVINGDVILVVFPPFQGTEE